MKTVLRVRLSFIPLLTCLVCVARRTRPFPLAFGCLLWWLQFGFHYSYFLWSFYFLAGWAPAMSLFYSLYHVMVVNFSAYICWLACVPPVTIMMSVRIMMMVTRSRTIATCMRVYGTLLKFCLSALFVHLSNCLCLRLWARDRKFREARVYLLQGEYCPSDRKHGCRILTPGGSQPDDTQANLSHALSQL